MRRNENGEGFEHGGELVRGGEVFAPQFRAGCVKNVPDENCWWKFVEQ
jgi:hypothetical protein